MKSHFVGAASLEYPVSQVCTAVQFADDHFVRLVTGFTQVPRIHRKQWEYAYILRVLECNDMLRVGRTGIGFGVGNEPILAAMAAAGTRLTATEHPDRRTGGDAQEAFGLMDSFYGGICPEDLFRERVRFRPVDANTLPRDLGTFDMLWACSVIEELGSIARGIDFVVESSRLLRGGGIAVFTTQFNATSDFDTIETPQLSVWRRLDLLDLQSRLVDAGCEFLPLCLTPGQLPEDGIVDVPPYDNPVHLKIENSGHTITSVGFAFRRP